MTEQEKYLDLLRTQIIVRDTGGFTSPNGNQNGIPAILHPNESVLNYKVMSAPGMSQILSNINTGQAIQTTTQLHPDSINAIINGINQGRASL